MIDIVSNPSIFIPFVHLFAFLCGNGMLEAMLESHIKAHGGETYEVGRAFMIFGGCYAAGNCVFGWVSLSKCLLSDVNS